MGYKKTFFKGIAWMGSLRLVTRIFSYVRLAILARLIGPGGFGIFGIASLVLTLLEALTQTGINVFLIQEESKLEKYVNTAWVVSIVRGILISCLMFSCSYPISMFFKNPDSLSIVRLISLVPLIRAFINPSIVKYQKNLNFNNEFRLRVLLLIVDAVVAISVALITKSAISLIWGMAASAVFEVLISFIFIKPKPKFEFNLNKFKSIVGRSKWNTLMGILSYIYKQGDDIVVGKLLGTYQLGLYQGAYKISTLPMNESGGVIRQVALPVLVKIRGDRSRLEKAYKNVIFVTILFVVPMGIVIYLFPELFIRILLGEKWLEAVSVVKILIIYGVIRAAVGPISSLLLSLKQQKHVFIYNLLATLVLMIIIIPLVKKYGINGAGTSALISWFFAIPLQIHYAKSAFKNEEK